MAVSVNGVQKGEKSNVTVEKPGRNLLNQVIKVNLTSDKYEGLLYLGGCDEKGISPLHVLLQNSYPHSNNAKRKKIRQTQFEEQSRKHLSSNL